MKKILMAICALLVILLVIGCTAPKEDTKEEAKEEPVDDTKEETVDDTKEETEDTEETAAVEVEEKEETEAEPEEPVGSAITGSVTVETNDKPAPSESKTIVEQSKEISPELKELLDKADRKVQSMVYLYAGPTTDNRFLDQYLVKGNYIKVDLYEKDPYIIEEYFDSVYLDTQEMTATARCEEKKRCISKNIDNTKRVFDADYSTYRMKTPYEWIKEVNYAEMVGPEVLDTRSVVKIKYHDAGSETEMWVDESYGVPLKIVRTYDSGDKETYQFKDFQFNTLKEEDVKPAFTEEIIEE